MGLLEQQQKEACDVNKLKWEKGSHWMNQREPLHSSHNTDREKDWLQLSLQLCHLHGHI